APVAFVNKVAETLAFIHRKIADDGQPAPIVYHLLQDLPSQPRSEVKERLVQVALVQNDPFRRQVHHQFEKLSRIPYGDITLALRDALTVVWMKGMRNHVTPISRIYEVASCEVSRCPAVEKHLATHYVSPAFPTAP